MRVSENLFVGLEAGAGLKVNNISYRNGKQVLCIKLGI